MQSTKFFRMKNQNPWERYIGSSQLYTLHMESDNQYRTRAPSCDLCYSRSITKVVWSSASIMLRPLDILNQEKAWIAFGPADRSDQCWHCSQARPQASGGTSANKLLKGASHYFPPEHEILWVLPELYGINTEYYRRLSFSWQEPEELAAYKEMKRDICLTVLSSCSFMQKLKLLLHYLKSYIYSSPSLIWMLPVCCLLWYQTHWVCQVFLQALNDLQEFSCREKLTLVPIFDIFLL